MWVIRTTRRKPRPSSASIMATTERKKAKRDLESSGLELPKAKKAKNDRTPATKHVMRLEGNGRTESKKVRQGPECEDYQRALLSIIDLALEMKKKDKTKASTSVKQFVTLYLSEAQMNPNIRRHTMAIVDS